jgi:hypothetical protein
MVQELLEGGESSVQVREGESDLPEDPHEAQRIRELYEFIRAEDPGEERITSEFKRPSLQMARVYANMNHPRKPGGGKYSAWALHTGRHMMSGWPWKVFDPFCEGTAAGGSLRRLTRGLLAGTTSELSRYGVGISLYFKFLKCTSGRPPPPPCSRPPWRRARQGCSGPSSACLCARCRSWRSMRRAGA